MGDAIVVALITLVGTIISVFVTSRATQDKVTHQLETQNEVQNQKIEQLGTDINTVKSELTDAISNNRRISDIKMQQLQDKQEEMAADLKEHNNYASKLPEIQGKLELIAEKQEVANKRINDLETFQRDSINRLINNK